MKARVKATGDIFEVSDTTTIYPEHYDKSYNITEVEFLDVKEKSFPKDEDYWTRLEHQYAGMAMQGILSNQDYCRLLIDENNKGSFAEEVSRCASDFAHTLVEKYKEKEERKNEG